MKAFFSDSLEQTKKKNFSTPREDFLFTGPIFKMQSFIREKCEAKAFDSPQVEVSAPTQVWTFCLDSHNIIREGPCDNPTNDTVLRVQMTTDRQIFYSEIPMLDFVECKLRVQKDLNLPMCENERTLRRLDCSELVLPPTWNRVDYEGDCVYRTESAHRLECSAGYAWLWGGSEPVLLCDQNGSLRHDVRILSEHTFTVRSHTREDALYVWSTPLTYQQITNWAGVPFDDLNLGLCGFVATPLYRRLIDRHDMEMLCHIPCLRRQASACDVRDVLQASANVTNLTNIVSIVITDYCGCELANVELGIGPFNPDGLCHELSRGHVSANIEYNRLRFCSHNGEPFRVKFTGRSRDGSFLGFASDVLEGRTSYEADKALCWELPPTEWRVFDCTKLSMTRSAVTNLGRIDCDKICFESSHGFRLNDAVIVTVGDEARLTRVIAVHLHSIEIDRPRGWHHDGASCNVRTFPAPIFLFGAGFDPILGNLMPSRSGGWVSRFPVDVRGPTYVMMQILDPIGSAQCEHVSETGAVSGYIGKCVFMSLFRTLNEHAPRVLRFFPARRVTEIHVRLLNPDGSLYNLYGMHWSATLLFRK